ncbi:Secretory pathway Sec39 [Penicillium taxi]|uniref:Secretory pathway Sec39 n=1 Tax=Penicillium taxi TaxID=168475 RepID=UPI002544DB2D|nr:Secretory pathway Sec39 [Penicillium taxi]KAJ5894185.1 Secretory pathway Sec39 [Penicillium taxi]
MVFLEGLSEAHAILLATTLCAGGDVAVLPSLRAQHPQCFPLERLLQIILTFLPESTQPSEYVPVLQELTSDSQNSQLQDIDTSAVIDLSELEARKRVSKLHLLPLKREEEDDEVISSQPLTQFLIHRAYLIDSETALQPLILDLIFPFYERDAVIRTWLISSLLPALRLNYEYYPNREDTLSLDTLELMDDQTAINVLLSITSEQNNKMDLVNNLRGLVGPWLYGSKRSKRRRLNEAAEHNTISYIQGTQKPRPAELAGWEYVNEWLLSRSLVNWDSVVCAFTNWNGPGDLDLGGYEPTDSQMPSDTAKDLLHRYAQSGLAVVYALANSSEVALDGSFAILERVAQLLSLEECSYLNSSIGSGLPSVDYDTGLISSGTRASLLQNALLASENPLTTPSPSSISFLSALLLSLRILTSLGHLLQCRAAANTCLHSSEDMQMAELKNVVASAVKQTRSQQDWQVVRQQLLWLRDWQVGPSDSGWDEPSTHQGLFWRVSRDTVEMEILKALLGAREYQLAVDLYIKSNPTPLTITQVEATVVEALFTAFDNASNGNKTRGGMKRAYEILQAFRPHFPESVSLKQINALIAATHALSFYSLTLQHGVPFQPVSIRIHHDPISLVETVLEQNAKSYTKLDDLLSIGRNLVFAGLLTPQTSNGTEPHLLRETISEADTLAIAERRIISLAISSALNSNDFGTAYSYILTRLPPPSQPSNTSSIPDDISWRAVYNAGRYRSTTPNTSKSLQAQITHLSQRMELLSLALVLVPSPDPLPEILGGWRRCDEEMSSLRASEQQEEDIWDSKGDTISTLPGGFGPSDSERDAFDTAQQRATRRARARAAMPHSHPHEAPMGLFEVARGAALALHKNAFPLRGAASASTSGPRAGPGAETTTGGDTSEYESALSPDGRVRKRDMVSSIVTGGLASGIGWVLGAEPVNK